MPVENTCPRCGAIRPANAPAGLCPQCLLRLGTGADLSARSRSEFEPDPTIARSLEGDRGFRLDSAGAAGPARASILSDLVATIGPVPRVLLRDGPADDPRPVRPSSEEMPDLKGDAARYQLLGEIARGGMGVILKGRDVDLGRDLAVKVLLEKHRDHPEMVRRFVEEAQIGGQLQHPGIVPVYELGQFPDRRLYIAMKLVRGRTLSALLEARKDAAEDRPRFLAIFEQVCQTMAYAHARGVIHRDLKPSNIMVGGFGEVQVMDWGLAKVLDQGGVADEELSRRVCDQSSAIRTVRSGSDVGDSRAGSVLGTPAYMSPEQARGELDTVDERTDVFGLGSILCEILTGHPAYVGRTSLELCLRAERADLAETLARLDACGAEGELIALAKSCLAPAAKDRPRDAGVVLASLTAYLASVEQRLRAAELAQAQAETRAAGERKRRFLTVGLAASVLVTAMVVMAGWIWVARQREARREATARAVNAALDDADRKREQARLAPGGNSTKWVEAIEAARRAEALVNQGEAEPILRDRVQTFLASLVRERDQAEANEKDRRMVERLAAIHDDYGVHLDAQKTDAEFAAAFGDYGVDVDTLPPDEAGARLRKSPVAVDLANFLDQWAFLRRFPEVNNLAGARRLVDIAKVADDDDWRNRLRDTLDPTITNSRRARHVLEQLAADADAEKLPEASVTRLAFALAWMGDVTKAIELLQRAQRVHPNDFWLNWDLAKQLTRAGQPDEAIRFYSVAVAIRPRSGLALNGLGTALHTRGRLAEAAETFRRVIRNEQDMAATPATASQVAAAHVGLGAVLLDQGEFEKADSEFRDAKRIKPDDDRLRNDIANLLMSRGEWNAALAELREAARIAPQRAHTHDLLGLTLLDMGRLDEAIAAFQEALDHDERFTPAYDNLGWAWLAKGAFAKALAISEQKRYHERRGRHGGPPPGESPSPGNPPPLGKGPPPSSGPPRPGGGLPHADVLRREAERMIALEARLPALLRGKDKPADAAETAEFARLCFRKQLDATAARLWSEAFAADPKLADDLRAENRLQAARAAALAGCGRGHDDPRPDADARARWRRQALDWLQAELAAAAQLLESETDCDRVTVAMRLGLWRVDPALAGLRDPDALAALPQAECRACRDFWSEVEVLQKQARNRVRATAPIHPS